MKLSARAAPGYFARPDPDHCGLLIHGHDPVRVSLRRQEVLAARLGPGDDMGLTRIAGADLRRDPAAVRDALKAMPMFADGPRVVWVEDATDAAAPAIVAALADHAPGDAWLLVTAGALTARSKLRTAFEDHRNAMSAAIYDDPPDRAEIEAILAREGLAALPRDAMEAVTALAAALDPSDFRQTLAKLALYKVGDPAPVTPDEIEAMAPLTREAEIEDLLNAMADGHAERIGPLVRRMQAQGIQPVALAIAASRHFRLLHAAAADPGGAAAGLSRARPPVFGPRRTRMARQATGWGVHRLEAALKVLTDTDLALRSSNPPPPMALMERTMIRVSMMCPR